MFIANAIRIVPAMKANAAAAIAGADIFRDGGEHLAGQCALVGAGNEQCQNEASMIAYSDHIAAEHLEVHARDPRPRRRSCAPTVRCSSANSPASSIPTSAAVQTIRCRRWRPAVIPEVCGSAHTSRSAPISGWTNVVSRRLRRQRPGKARLKVWKVIGGQQLCVCQRDLRSQRIEIRAASPVPPRISKCQIPHSDMRQQVGFSAEH